jgi:hypothetical protein
MDQITLKFSYPINTSVQVGDIAYFTKATNAYKSNDIKKIGKIITIDQTTNTLECEISPSQERPSIPDFILFSKDNTQNTGSVLGYYARLQFRNDSTEYAEIFSIGSEVFDSSK